MREKGTAMILEPAHSAQRSGRNRWVNAARFGGYVLGALWMAGGTVFFFVRFGSVFYRANQSAIDKVIGMLTGRS
jgi:hypothetical protein